MSTNFREVPCSVKISPVCLKTCIQLIIIIIIIIIIIVFGIQKLPNQDKIRMLVEKETYKFLGILEADTIN